MTIRRLDSRSALMAVQNTRTRKNKGEKDAEFVKRIVNAYMDAEEFLAAEAKKRREEDKRYNEMLREFNLHR